MLYWVPHYIWAAWLIAVQDQTSEKMMMVNISKTACVFLMELVYNSFFFINSTSEMITEADYKKVHFKAISL